MQAGYEVLQAGDGAEGVRLARQHEPDLIVMDVTLPVLDGISAVRELKADPLTAEVPVIFVSGEAFAARPARAAGGAMFLAKPVRAADLLAAIAGTIGQMAGRDARRSTHTAADQAADKS